MTNDKASSVLPRPLAEYEFNSVYGFVPSEDPLRRLPNTGPFDALERVLEDLQGLLLTGQLRATIQRLPVISASEVDTLQTLREQQRAYQVVSMLAQAYVWGKNEAAVNHLPASLAVPLCEVSAILGINPIMANAATAAWNWRRLDPSLPCVLDNIMTLNTFTGSMDESWFFTVTAAIEARGGVLIYALLEAAAEAQAPQPDLANMARCLDAVADEMVEMVKLLGRMRAHCDPRIFYETIRVYLAGWTNLAQVGIPEGVHYEGVDPPGVYRRYAGASAGQSALMHVLDVGLGIQHCETGRTDSRNSHMLEMREHLPGPQRAFIEDLERASQIRHCVLHRLKRSGPGKETTAAAAVITAYDRCVLQMQRFRDRHMQLASAYIVMQASKKGAAAKTTNGRVRGALPAPHERDAALPVSDGGSGASTPAADNDDGTSLSSVDSFSAEASVDLRHLTIPITITPSGAVDGTATANSCDGLRTTTLAVTTYSAVGTNSDDESESESESDGGIEQHNQVVYGTGGTDIIPFLKQMRDETRAALSTS